MAKKADPTEVPVTYDLFDLPTAFHKAGLAGLVLLIRSLTERGSAEGMAIAKAAWAALEPTLTPTSVTVPFNEPLLRLLMNDLYDAKYVERDYDKQKKDSKGKIRPEKRIKEIEVEGRGGKKVTKQMYVYDETQPLGQFIRDHYPEMDDSKSWHKLWREMLWEVPRGRHKSREPFDQRAAGVICKEGPNAWADLLKVHTARAKGQVFTTEVSSALLIGAQALNAEGVAFEGRAEHNILLHFWPLVVLLYVPQSVDREGTTKFVGYTVAVPEVADLAQFLDDFPRAVAALPNGVRGFRPAGAVIDLPAAGALESLAAIASVRAEKDSGLEYTVGGMDYLHMVKIGDNVKIMTAGRVAADRNLIAAYRQLVPPAGQPAPYRSTLFRRGLLVALLERHPWWRPFIHTFKTFEADVFLRPVGPPAPGKASSKDKEFRRGKLTEAGKKRPQMFAADAAERLRRERDQYTQHVKRKAPMPDDPRPPAPLSVLVEQVIRSYLLGKAKKKCNLDPATKLSGLTKEQKADVYKKKREVAREAFLAAKARHDQDFVAYFSEVLCSAGTFFDRRTADFQAFAVSLVDPTKTADIKTLTLLALSANS